ncbi:MAG: nucleotidyltransferase domain-containing protein [Faecalibacterium sp.]
MEKLNAIREQVIQLCDPQKILLFGSQAKGTATAKSDIDLCIIASTNDKRSLLTDLYCDTESDTPIDFLCIRRRSGNTAWQIARALPTS